MSQELYGDWGNEVVTELELCYRNKRKWTVKERRHRNKGIITLDKHEIQEASRNRLLEMTLKTGNSPYMQS